MQFIKEIQDRGFKVPTSTPVVHFHLFEDNSGALELARVPNKLRSRTKHMNLKYHHYRSFARKSLISIHHIGTLEQPADVMTKPLGEDDFKRHRFTLMGW